MSAQPPDLSITADTVLGRRDALTASPSRALPAANSPTGGKLPLSATGRTRHRRYRHPGGQQAGDQRQHGRQSARRQPRYQRPGAPDCSPGGAGG